MGLIILEFFITERKHRKHNSNFGSAAMLNSTYKKVKAEADKVGVPMDEREFHCKGEFKGVHKGKPDEKDLKAAAEFARKIVEG